ncbi:hypothetical protein ACMAZF_09735 [Psychrobium sp. nBUS_13]|uniref:hypothetical protein n=1 Tax=Psychrobium sp. nBUS_13 TaxID=3395319 RepID=UPI003EB9EDF2
MSISVPVFVKRGLIDANEKELFNEYRSMRDENQSSEIVINSKIAIELYLKGRDCWNSWFKMAEQCKVSFSNVDFSKLLKEEKLTRIDFSGFTFPNGGVDFSFTIFDGADVLFEDTNFGTGDISFFGAEITSSNKVSFEGAIFDGGYVDFSQSKFTAKNVSFYNARFGSGNIRFDNFQCRNDEQSNAAFRMTPKYFNASLLSFDDALFSRVNIYVKLCHSGDGHFTFSNVALEKGGLLLERCQMGNGIKNFNFTDFSKSSFIVAYSQFNDGNVSFKSCRFRQSQPIFRDVSFGDGDISMTGANFDIPYLDFGSVNFGNGIIDFNNVHFNEGSVIFSNAIFGNSTVSFQHVNFKSGLLLSSLQGSEKISEISFRHSCFNSGFDLDDNKFNCVIDLTSTSLSHHVSLEQVKFVPKFHKTPKFPSLYKFFNEQKNWLPNKVNKWIADHMFFDVIKDPHDVERLCRLKELAADNQDYLQVLNFHADELRARRTLFKVTKFKAGLDHLYQIFSDYGRSVLRPSIWLICSWFFFACIYFNMSDVNHFQLEVGDKLIAALSYSGGYTVPLLPDGRFSRLEGLELLFDGKASGCLHLANFLQGLFSTGFIFLIGLGLRNRFRI